MTLIIAFTCLIIVTFMAIFSLAVLIGRHNFASYAETNMRDLIANYDESIPKKKKTIDDIQQELKCCGIREKLEWIESRYNKFPDSCCEQQNGACLAPFDDVCLSQIEQIFSDPLFAIAAIGVTAAFIAFTTLCINILTVTKTFTCYKLLPIHMF